MISSYSYLTSASSPHAASSFCSLPNAQLFSPILSQVLFSIYSLSSTFPFVLILAPSIIQLIFLLFLSLVTNNLGKQYILCSFIPLKLLK